MACISMTVCSPTFRLGLEALCLQQPTKFAQLSSDDDRPWIREVVLGKWKQSKLVNHAVQSTIRSTPLNRCRWGHMGQGKCAVGNAADAHLVNLLETRSNVSCLDFRNSGNSEFVQAIVLSTCIFLHLTVADCNIRCPGRLFLALKVA